MSHGPSPARREIGRLLHRHRRALALALLLIATNRLAALALPAASRYVVDEVIGRQRLDRLGLVGLLACAAVVVEASAAYGVALVAGTAGQRASAELRRQLQSRVLGLPLRTLENSPGAVMAARVVTDPEQLRYLVGNGLLQLAASVLTAALALGLLFHLDTSLTLGVVALVTLVAFGIRNSFGSITPAFDRVLRGQVELTGQLSQTLSGIRTVKAYAAERREAACFTRESHGLMRESVAVLRRIARLNAGTALAAGALGAFLLVAGGRSVADGSMTLGSFVMYAWVSGLLLGPVLHISGSAGDLGKAMAAAGRISELRGFPTESEEWSGAPAPPLIGGVEFECVSYRYRPDRIALRAVSLCAPAGSTTALVGPNGSGKSTLCRLLLAYDRPMAGRILVDGRDLSTIDRRFYRSHVGVVLQDEILFDGTIADNIRYGKPRASLDEVRAAARLAHCDEFISRLPERYMTVVGERGSRLSAGQRQRVAIARAFLVDPRILVLDEPDASLDSESEAVIRDALRFLCQGRTTFIIAHHPGMVGHADQILVLDQGAIIGRGTQDDLMRLNRRGG